MLIVMPRLGRGGPVLGDVFCEELLAAADAARDDGRLCGRHSPPHLLTGAPCFASCHDVEDHTDAFIDYQSWVWMWSVRHISASRVSVLYQFDYCRSTQ